LKIIFFVVAAVAP